MTTLLNRHTTSDLAHATRAAQRKQRLRQIENEMRLEDAEALKMTEEQRQTLLRSFTSVKVEFSDLDGLAWHAPTQAPLSPSTHLTPQVQSPDHAFVVLTNADLASFAPHETIRASAASRPKPRSSVSSPNLSAAAGFSPSLPHTRKHSYSALSSFSSSPSATITAILKGKNSRSRSPVKGLFPSQNLDANESDSDCTVRGSDSDLDGSPRPRKERKKSRSGRRRITSGPCHISASVSSPISGFRSNVASGASRGSGKPSDESMAASWSVPHDEAGGSSSSRTARGAADSNTLPRQYPAYITYSPSPSPAPISYSPPLNIPQTAKPSIFPSAPKPGSASTVINHLLGSA